ncbi:MAG: hypothetical protein NC434_10890 [Ruminococcus sp.]|nr:hypothetical protein [Ruminococcus sp.]
MDTSNNLGFCPYAGHSGSIQLTWVDNTVISAECAFGNHETCGYADECRLYQRQPVGSVQTYPLKNKSL